MKTARIPDWTPPIDGWHYPIERTASGSVFIVGPSFRIVKLPRRWRVTYTAPSGNLYTGWSKKSETMPEALRSVCKSLTQWIEEGRKGQAGPS